MPSAPFVVGQWVRGPRFYGRAALIEEVLEGHRNWIWVLGTRRIGKTSLLKQIEYLTGRAGSGWLPLYWDFQGANDSQELHHGLREAFLDAEESLGSAGIAWAASEGADVFETLGRLRRLVKAAGLRLLVLCDEVEELIAIDKRDPAVLSKLRRVMQSQEDIRTVMVSTIRLWELSERRGDTSPFLHGFTPPLFIERLTDQEARSLIRQEHLAEDSRPSFPEDAIEEIRARCDNHPYLMQLVCKRYHEIGQVVEAVEEVATDPMVSYFFSVDFEMLSGLEREAIRIIADLQSADSNSIQGRLAVDPDAMRGILDRLEHLGYVRRGAHRRFELANEFFRRWFRERPRGRPGPRAGPGPPAAPEVGEISTQVGGADKGLFDDRYEFVERIGSGATGVVHRAFDRMARQTIAIKILRTECCASPEMLERFRQETLLARDIAHPNILRVYHLGEFRGTPYLTMQWIPGPTLAAVIMREAPLSVGRLVAIAWKLASALEAAHARKVIHRDIKPLNILLDEDDEPRLSDFGVARLAGSPGATGPGTFVGTPYYASPEQADLRPPDERSDLYSLGVVMFEMATGRRPFVAESVQELLEMHRSLPPPDPSALRSDLPRPLSGIILRCLEKDPARRYPDAAALRDALAGIRTLLGA